MQMSQEADQVVWYSHLFKNFPQSVVIHTAKGFVVVNKAEIDVFLKLSCFFDNPTDVGLPYFLLRQGFFLLFVFAMIIPLRCLQEVKTGYLPVSVVTSISESKQGAGYKFLS